MTMFKRTAIALSLAAAVGAIATPSFAQTTRAQRAAAAQAQAQMQYDTPMRWQRAPMAYGWNAYALANGARQLNFDPNGCVSDEGYGRIGPCPNGE